MVVYVLVAKVSPDVLVLPEIIGASLQTPESLLGWLREAGRQDHMGRRWIGLMTSEKHGFYIVELKSNEIFAPGRTQQAWICCRRWHASGEIDPIVWNHANHRLLYGRSGEFLE